MRLVRSQETEEDREARLTSSQERQARLRATETSAQRESRLSSQRSQTEATRIRRAWNSVRPVCSPIVKLMHYHVSLRLLLIGNPPQLSEYSDSKCPILRDSNGSTSHCRSSKLMHYREFTIDSIPQGQNNNYKVIIKADRRPAEEHRGRYNAPVVDEVAVILVDQECDRRDIVLRSR
ncbi:hypothetical protein EVAR_99290_1 [Eumeta japonica]|uniref:Uncharacterized protein n=1 Tax=Eumeta variegata TaxID=151549 RepID=A0A4C2A0L2_EUMVA|nr:hypothetical protein EVAR_99290_1 [Eumeta japonica]